LGAPTIYKRSYYKRLIYQRFTKYSTPGYYFILPMHTYFNVLLPPTVSLLLTIVYIKNYIHNCVIYINDYTVYIVEAQGKVRAEAGRIRAI
jgi:hypothetical protein